MFPGWLQHLGLGMAGWGWGPGQGQQETSKVPWMGRPFEEILSAGLSDNPKDVVTDRGTPGARVRGWTLLKSRRVTVTQNLEA